MTGQQAKHVLDEIVTFSDPVEKQAALDALRADMKNAVLTVAPALEEPHGVSFEDNDGVLYPYVF